MEKHSRNFHHPYEPYDIQVKLMNAIYDCIDEGKIGIFESPTGTGKSLSLICSSLVWLRDAQEHAPQSQDVKDEPDWVLDHAQMRRKDDMIRKRAELEERLQQIRTKEKLEKQRFENGEPRIKRMRLGTLESNQEAVNDADFVPDEYNSEGEREENHASAPTDQRRDQNLSTASMQLMEKLGLVFDGHAQDEDLESLDELKIYFSSRTHSQLTQFVQEVRRVTIPPASWVVESDALNSTEIAIRHTPLGSRKNLCINPKVSKLGSATAINERCLELQQATTPKDHKCPFVPSSENQTLVNDFRDHTFAKIRDIEDLGMLGRRIGICPYYASRATIKPSAMITLPYPMLLQKSAREALNISLKGHVVIIDEAHNLMDTISNIHSISITITQLRRCRSQLGTYLQKFRNMLKGKNRVYAAQIIRLIDSLVLCLETVALDKYRIDGVLEVGSLMAGKGVDQINLYKLVHYLQESKLARKVERYAIHVEEQSHKASIKVDVEQYCPTAPALTLLQSFLLTLINPAAEGRFFFEKDDPGEISLKYLLLDPSHHFREITEEARAVLLVGGTMSPMDDYAHHLFPYVNGARLATFSCGHIVPKENLIVMAVAKGLGGKDFDFTFEKRNSSIMIETLGNSLVSISSNVPDGLVVFFPSYAYLDQVIHHWQLKSSKTMVNIWDRLQERKPIFREDKSSPGVDDVLSQYSQAISADKGGLLLSVIGGKLSEGINFSDSLGRGVIVVGLPFPNIQSAQWKAKLEYIEGTASARAGDKGHGKVAAREFYENACMRAVNQSIGRAIRHKGDYASIMLLDRRYSTQRIMSKLPDWIRQAIGSGGPDQDFGKVVGELGMFFDSK